MTPEQVAKKIQACADELEVKPYEVTWDDLRKFAHFNKGALSHLGGFMRVRDSFFPPEHLPERKRIQDLSNIHRRMSMESSRIEVFKQEMLHYLEKVIKVGQVPRWNPPKLKHKISRVIQAVISDHHVGSDIEGAETGGSDFGRKEEARRLAAYCLQVADYKTAYRDRTSLHLQVLGDEINNWLHDKTGAPLAEQSCRAMHLLVQAITFWSSAFAVVDVEFATGNHGRNIARHQSRASHQKWDSNETTIYYGVMLACRGLKNVRFHLPKTPFVSYDVLGHRFFGTHGDTVLSVGNPGKTIPVSSLENQTNRINAGIRRMAEEHGIKVDGYDVFTVGHVHFSSVSHLNNGTVLITNGPLVPVDPYAVSIGIVHNETGQWLFETTKEYAVGDMRLVKLGIKEDRDASLDKIIVPWKGFE